MFRVAIVEDEAMYVKQMVNFLHQYEKEREESFTIIHYPDGDGIVANYKAQFDIILMDIQMRFMDGMSAAEEIRRVDKEVVIIFITNMPQYAIRGYAVEALDYVVKPLSYFAFTQSLLRAMERLSKRSQKTILVNIKGGTLRIDATDVCYVESQGHTIIYHTCAGDFETTGTMKELESSLTPYDFFRGNKGYLINLAHVEGVLDSCAIVRGEKLLLSRYRKAQFMQALTNYWCDRK